jgi:RNA 2',3'-cyclic 3'-phosphodiesterase
LGEGVIRLFTGIELDNGVKSSVEALYHRFDRHKEILKFTPKENLHITLNFLGDVFEEKIPEAVKAVEEAAASHDAFFASASGISCFGSPKYARVIWAGIDRHSLKVSALYESLKINLEAAGFEQEKRAYTPHITIARCKEGVNIARILPDIKFDFKIKVSKITLFKSTLENSGALHEILFEKELKPAGEDSGF